MIVHTKRSLQLGTFMLHHDIHEKLLAYTDRELELLRANYQLCHKFKSHMERRFSKTTTFILKSRPDLLKFRCILMALSSLFIYIRVKCIRRLMKKVSL